MNEAEVLRHFIISMLAIGGFSLIIRKLQGKKMNIGDFFSLIFIILFWIIQVFWPFLSSL